ncbi:uncharacterized protein EV420DRAFT_1673561 [Desarmillaria tabescens]|uniref:Uncharacterized protein n=1 Tax=Armillaria tabescens TaxID=1929756 RepID=A0AA39J4U5_ARMTA|nr:uncharacterized protein EV420DRAFT_1673561 [Desarmillaria tabescens]KAK0436176.1 hypothetical protein EV420DRAFT_1673561 [Desarmillaria tabescens]
MGQVMMSKTTMILRHELRVSDDLDVMVRLLLDTPWSESVVKLRAKFLDIDTDGRVMAEHFAHGVYSYVRSLFKDLFMYDSSVQYDTSPHVSSPSRPRPRRSRGVDEHLRQRSRSRIRSPSPCGHDDAPSSLRDARRSEDDISPVRLISWSPSRHHYPSASSASSPSVTRVTIPDEIDIPASTTNPIERPCLPEVKSKSRVTDEPHGATPSDVGLQSDVKEKSRVDTSRFSPASSNSTSNSFVPPLDSLRVHLDVTSASSSSSPNFLSQLSRGESRKSSADAWGSQSSLDAMSDWDHKTPSPA